MKKQKRQLIPEEELLKDYRRKLMAEAFFKSLIIGLISGFILSIPVSVISFITVYNTLWIALLIFGAATVGFTLLSYFKYYRTNLRETAIRVDGAGLEERVITMIECAGRDDAIAGRQREDAKRALKTVDTKKVKIPFPKTPFIVLAAAAVVGICLMVTSTVHVNRVADAQKEANSNSSVTQPEDDEDRIIREMLEALRQTIDDAPVRDELKDILHKMVDDLEASLKPEDSTEVKIAKISETAQKIHKIIQDELSKTTIAQELQKHETTRQLGKAIESEDIEKIEKAFKDMYDSIAPLAYEKKYDRLYQTAQDILQSLEDADIKPDDALAKALEDLAEAFLKAIEIPPPEEGEEDRVNDEINEAVQDAIKDALDAIKDAMQQQQDEEDLDEALEDIFKDAMEQLGQESDSDSNGEEENPDEDDENKDEEDENGDQSSTPSPGDGDMLFWTVIDGETPYPEVYDEYYEWAMEMLTNGNLTDSERRMIENYLNMLKTEYGYGED